MAAENGEVTAQDLINKVISHEPGIYRVVESWIIGGERQRILRGEFYEDWKTADAARETLVKIKHQAKHVPASTLYSVYPEGNLPEGVLRVTDPLISNSTCRRK